jgi:hypothetical protein
MSVGVWERVEVTLEAESTYENPYVEVDVWVDLEGPGFSKRCYGFWDGGNLFRVRVAATAPGSWRWKSGSSTNDPGLSGKKGSFEARSWSEDELRENPNRRGIVRATENGHGLQYADGTPFYLLGDTMWAIPSYRFPWYDDDEPREPGPEMGFKDMIKYRKKQEFNSVNILACFPNWQNDGKPARIVNDEGIVIRAAWPAPNGSAKDMHNEGGLPFGFPGKVPGYEDVFPDINLINPEYFQYVDRKMDFLQEQGFAPFLEVLRRDATQPWKRYYSWPDSYARYIHYVFTRYQANNVILSPIHFDTKVDSLPPRDFIEPANLVHEKYGPPPFGNLVSTNAGPSTLCQFGHVTEAPWLTMHQIGNQREHDYYWYLTEIYNKEPALPAMHGEPYYSGWGTQVEYYKDFAVPGDTPKDDRYVRSGMYGSFLSGGLAGYVYGCTGLVRAVIEPEFPTKIWVGLQWSSATMTSIFKKFVFCEGNRYTELIPNAEWVSPSKDHNLRSYDGWAYCARTEERDLILLYFEKGIAPGYVRAAKNNTRYRADWYDVRTGEWKAAGELDSDDLEMIDLPEKPDDEDWAMRLKAIGPAPSSD